MSRRMKNKTRAQLKEWNEREDEAKFLVYVTSVFIQIEKETETRRESSFENLTHAGEYLN